VLLMAYQMAQKGAFWPSSGIRLGPHWRYTKTIWANFIHAILDVGT